MEKCDLNIEGSSNDMVVHTINRLHCIHIPMCTQRYGNMGIMKKYMHIQYNDNYQQNGCERDI